MNFTSQQQKVIDTRKKNILVSAAAGSGKTAVLVERILSRILDPYDPVDIDRLLVVTFTRAAASQMRERIAAALSARSETILQDATGSEEDSRRMLLRIQRQEMLLHNARITTIDSFCSYLLRNHFSEIGLDPGFRLMTDTEARLVFQDVLAAFIESRYASGDPGFLFCTSYFCQGLTDREMEKILTDLYEEADSHPEPEAWLEERKKDYDPGSGRKALDRLIVRMGLQLLDETAEQYPGLVSLCLSPGGPVPYEENLRTELEALRHAGRPDNTETLTEAFREVLSAFGKLKPVSEKKYPETDPEIKEYVKNQRTALRDRLKKFSSTYLGVRQEEEQKDSLCAAAIRAVMEETKQLYAAFREKKQAVNAIDFSDLEHLALRILLKDGMPTDTARLYRSLYDEVMIDEYQDSNDIQELILSTISGNAEGRFNRFMVGDVKQSIYRFRQARPEIFMEKAEEYGYEGDASIRIDLDRNFRSRHQVLDTVNAVFRKLMRKEIGGVTYDSSQYLIPGADYGEDPDEPLYDTEMLLVEKKTGQAEPETEEDENDLTPAQKEAFAIAGRIRGMVGSLPVSDGQGGQRPARYSDIAVLLRSDSGWTDTFKNVFEEMRIPVSVQTAAGYFGAGEIRDILQVLRIIDNPLQDIPFYGAMRSYFGGFSEEDAAWVRILAGREDENIFLYDAVKKTADSGETGTPLSPPALREKCRSFLTFIEQYRKKAVYLDMQSLLTELIDGTGYLAYCMALPQGAVRSSNLKMFIQRAAEFETTQYSGLFRFLRYIDEMMSYQIDFGEAGNPDDASDAVRLMSIHKSKGLEFPVCFVVGLGRKMNMTDAAAPVIIDPDLGAGCDAVDTKARIRYKSRRKQLIADKIRRDSLGEELRILYVAMTRAREKLILSASVENAAQRITRVPAGGQDTAPSPGRLPAPLSVTSLSGAGSFAELILRAAESCRKESGTVPLRLCAVGDMSLSQEEEQADSVLSEKRMKLDGIAERYAADGISALPDPALADELEEKFAFRYAYSALSGLYTKTTVSELKKAAMYRLDEDGTAAAENADGPAGAGARKESAGGHGAEYGTIVHRLMELMDAEIFNAGTVSSTILTDWICSLKDDGRLTKEEYAMIRPGRLLPFFSSDLFRRMGRAFRENCLFREQPFVMRVPASALDASLPDSESVLVQGIIDAFFLEGDSIILLDYKTDYAESEKVLTDRYTVQLDYYAAALHKIFHRKVTEKLIYSFSLDRTIRL